MRSFRRSTYLPKDLATQLYGSIQAFGNTAKARHTYGFKRTDFDTSPQASQPVSAPSMQVAQPAQTMSAAA